MFTLILRVFLTDSLDPIDDVESFVDLVCVIVRGSPRMPYGCAHAQ